MQRSDEVRGSGVDYIPLGGLQSGDFRLGVRDLQEYEPVHVGGLGTREVAVGLVPRYVALVAFKDDPESRFPRCQLVRSAPDDVVLPNVLERVDSRHLLRPDLQSASYLTQVADERAIRISQGQPYRIVVEFVDNDIPVRVPKLLQRAAARMSFDPALDRLHYVVRNDWPAFERACVVKVVL